MNKPRYTLMILLAAAFMFPLLAADLTYISSLDRIRAVVNGKIITQGDIDLMAWNLSDKKRNENVYLNQLINDILLREKAKELEKMGIRIDQSWIDRRVRELQGEGYTHPVSYLRKIVEMEAIRIHIKRYFIKRGITVSPDDIREYYKRNIEDFSDAAKVLIRAIAIRFYPRPDIEAGIEEIRSTLKEILPVLKDTEKAKKIEKLNEQLVNAGKDKSALIPDVLRLLQTCMNSNNPILKKKSEQLYEKYKYFKTEQKASEICATILAELKNGEDFGSLVIRYSEGTFRNSGGKWDWFRKDGLSGRLSIIEKQAFQLKDQEISGILDTGNAKYIIQKIGNKPASLKSLSNPGVQKEIHHIIFRRKEKEEEQKLLGELRGTAYIRIFK